MIKKVLKSFIILLFISGNAYSYCDYLPDKPDEVYKPSKPYCVNFGDDTSECSDWEIDNYNEEINEYNEYYRKLENYIEVLKCLYNEAVDEYDRNQ